MRIIGGRHRGRKLASFEGEDIRPTSDRAKESLFNILSAKLVGSEVLDLFCGSGSLGLESISRGAASAHFNDLSEKSLALLKKNIQALGEAGLCTVTKSDYKACLTATCSRFDIIFIDPPYMCDYYLPALKIIAERKLLKDGGVVVCERDSEVNAESSGLTRYDVRKYGKAYLSFFRLEGGNN